MALCCVSSPVRLKETQNILKQNKPNKKTTRTKLGPSRQLTSSLSPVRCCQTLRTSESSNFSFKPSEVTLGKVSSSHVLTETSIQYLPLPSDSPTFFTLVTITTYVKVMIWPRSAPTFGDCCYSYNNTTSNAEPCCYGS